MTVSVDVKCLAMSAAKHGTPCFRQQHGDGSGQSCRSAPSYAREPQSYSTEEINGTTATAKFTCIAREVVAKATKAARVVADAVLRRFTERVLLMREQKTTAIAIAKMDWDVPARLLLLQ